VALINRLTEAGFTIYPKEVFTSLGAMRELLIVRGIKQFVLFPPSHLTTTHGDVHRPYLLLSDSALADFSDFPTARPSALSKPERTYDAVVIGLAYDKFSYANLNTAFRVLMSSTTNTTPSIPLLATHCARYVRDMNGELSLGPGPFVAALENAVGGGFKAQAVGKPERAFFEVCLQSLGVDIHGKSEEGIRLGDVAVIGDDAEADLGGGAVELGLQRMLGEHIRLGEC
jgi:ribonucleotide monophosphatase NagD (HAD superfamily)